MAFVKLNPREFSDTSLSFEVRERKPRVICAVDGREKSGKTHLCLDAPDPVALLSFDFGDEDVVQKFQDKGRQVVVADLKWEVPKEFRGGMGTITDAAKGDALSKWICDKVWGPFLYTVNKIIASGQFRTVVVDKATEAWQVCRLGVYGRLASNRQDLQTEANARWREFVRLFAASELPINLMLIHDQREEWVSKKVEEKGGDGSTEKWFKSGAWVRDGNDKVPFLIQVGLETRFIPPVKHPTRQAIVHEHKFEAEVKINRGHPEVVGTVFDNAEWLDVMTTCRPEIPLEDWGHALTRG